MYRMRESWTDERLDDFRDEVNRRFDKFEGDVNRRFDKFEGEVDRRFGEVGKRFDQVDGELHRLNDSFAALNRTLLQIGGGAIATMIAGILGVIATQL